MNSTVTSGRIPRSSVLFAISVAFFASARPASAVEICFRPTATVSSGTVLLKDVAVVNAVDAATAARLENIVVAPAPAAGRRMRLDYAEVRSRLEATGISPTQLNYSGSSVIVVASTQPAPPPKPIRPKKSRAATTVVAPAQVKRAEKLVTEAIRRSLGTNRREAAKLFIETIVEPAYVPLVLAGAAEGLAVGTIDLRATEPQTVPIDFQNAAGQTIRIQVQCVISERPQVPVLTHSIATGEVIHESDLARQPVDSTEGILTRLEEISGKEARKGIHANEPIRADDVRTIPLVRSNDIVTGVWRSGGIRITGQFKAKGDGGLGDVITLVKLTGRDQLLARVTEVHEAEIINADQAAARRGDGDDAEIGQTVVRRTPPPRVLRTPRPVMRTASAARPARGAIREKGDERDGGVAGAAFSAGTQPGPVIPAVHTITTEPDRER